jgi:hypothetical protein
MGRGHVCVLSFYLSYAFSMRLWRPLSRRPLATRESSTSTGPYKPHVVLYVYRHAKRRRSAYVHHVLYAVHRNTRKALTAKGKEKEP